MDINDKTESLYSGNAQIGNEGNSLYNNPAGGSGVYCVTCGELVETGNSFCVNCGTPVSESLSRPAYTPPVGSQYPGDAAQPDAFPSQAGYVPVDAPIYQTGYTPVDAPLSHTGYTPVDAPLADYTPTYDTSPQMGYEQQLTPQQQSYGYPPVQGGPAPKKQLNVAAIVAAVVIFLALLGGGLYYYFFIFSAQGEGAGPDISNGQRPGDPGQRETPGERDPPAVPTPSPPLQTPAPADPTPPVPAELRSFDITYAGTAVTNITLLEGEGIELYVDIDPVNAEAEINWISSDSRVFTVTPSGSGGRSATINGVSAGNAILTVTVGTIVNTCAIWINELPTPPPQTTSPQPGTALRELYDELGNRRSGVYLLISWTDGPHSGNSSALYRDAGSDMWMMDGVTSTREVFPEFGYDGTAFIISWPRLTSTDRRYYLMENGTGYFSEPDGTGRENLRWEFIFW